MMRTQVVAVFAVVNLTVPVLGQTTAQAPEPPVTGEIAAPASQPATPTTIPVDGSTPLGALKAYYYAQVNNDVPAMRDAFHAGDADAQRLLDARVATHEALVRLHAAVTTKFNASVAYHLRLPTTRPNTPPGLIDRFLLPGEQTIDGDRATLNFGGRQVVLLKRDERWRIDIGTDLGHMPPAILEARARAYQEVAEEVESGKHLSPPSIGESLSSKLDAYVGAATQPTTRPATAPDSSP